MSKVLVTGGAGFIGSHLVDRLIGEGLDVVVLDNLASGKRHHLDEAGKSGRLRFIEGSILEPDAIDAAMAGCDEVYHLAVECVRRSLGDPVSNHHVNATGTLHVLEAARAHSVRRFVYCSSSEVYGNASRGLLSEDRTLPAPTTVYGAAKLTGEHYALAYWQTYGLPTVVVRPFNAFGPREHETGDLAEVIPRFLIRVLNGASPVIFGSGRQGRDFTFVSDTVRGLTLAAKSETLIGGIVNLGHGRLITIAEVAGAVMRAAGRNDLQTTYIEPRPGEVDSLIADTRRAEEVLGFKAEISFDDGLGRYVDWFRNTHADPSVLMEEAIRNWRMPDDSPSAVQADCLVREKPA